MNIAYGKVHTNHWSRNSLKTKPKKY